MTLTTIIDDYLTQDRGDLIHLDIPIHQDTRDNAKFRASDAGRCRLMRYWKRQGKSGKNTNAGALRVMESGNILHAWLNHVCQAMGYLDSGEHELEDLHRIGHLDAVLNVNGSRILYDFKTISSKKLYFFDKNGGEADKAHQFQIVTYYEMLPCDDTVDDLRIAYICRDSLEIREVSVHLEAVQSHVVHDWVLLFEAWEQQKEPDPNSQSWECNYCIYRDSCPHSHS